MLILCVAFSLQYKIRRLCQLESTTNSTSPIRKRSLRVSDQLWYGADAAKSVSYGCENTSRLEIKRQVSLVFSPCAVWICTWILTNTLWTQNIACQSVETASCLVRGNKQMHMTPTHWAGSQVNPVQHWIPMLRKEHLKVCVSDQTQTLCTKEKPAYVCAFLWNKLGYLRVKLCQISKCKLRCWHLFTDMLFIEASKFVGLLHVGLQRPYSRQKITCTEMNKKIEITNTNSNTSMYQ